jgi:hypothetical protein
LNRAGRTTLSVTARKISERTMCLTAIERAPRWRASHNPTGQTPAITRAVTQLNPCTDAASGTQTAIVSQEHASVGPTLSTRLRRSANGPSAAIGTPMPKKTRQRSTHADVSAAASMVMR